MPESLERLQSTDEDLMRLLFLCLVFLPGLAWGDLQAKEALDLDRLVDAVGRAENSTTSPYGLITDKWCIKEGACRYYAKEILRIHSGRCDSDDFDLDLRVECIGSYYAPKNVENDPRNLNSHWVKNVKYFYNKGK